MQRPSPHRRLAELIGRGASALALALGLAGLAPADAARAQEQYAAADEGARAPRFLIAPASPRSRPVPLDVRRTPALLRRIDVDLDGVPLKEALAEISARSGLALVYGDGVLPNDKRVHLRADRITVAAALTDVLVDVGVDVLFNPRGGATIVRRTARGVLAGEIRGRVTDSATAEGVAGVGVYLEGTRWRTTTDAQGRYRLTDVEPGKYTLVARRLGYARRTVPLDVATSELTLLDVALSPAASNLNEVVVTATGKQRLLELGHVVGQINADSLVKQAPVSNISELLTGRIPGVQVFQTQGTVGGDVQLQVRTPNSLLLATQPIVIVDGVRYTNTPALEGLRRGGLSGMPGGGGVNVEPTSPLNDLNPNEIETMEVVKGPSAATLYGTDAANGVVVITTKRGRPGPARWSTYARLGITEPADIRPPKRYWAWGTRPDGSPSTANCSLAQVARGSCVQDSITTIPSPFDDPAYTILADAPRWEYGMNVSGGRPELRYYFGGDVEQATGPFRMPPAYADSIARARGASLPEEQRKPNAFSKINLRSNLTAAVGERVELEANLGYVRRSNRTMSLENPYTSAASGGPSDPTNPHGQGNDPAAQFSNMSTEEADRFLIGARANARVTSWLQARAAVGLDLTSVMRHTLARRGETPNSATSTSLGSVRDDRSEQRQSTADLGLTASLGRGRVSSRTTVGAQYVRASNETQTASGTDLIPGGESVTQATNRSANQLFTERATLGGYVEETIGLNDRLFLTGAVRADGASAFGRAYRAAVYPKVSASWLLSEEPFLPRLPGLDELRVRYAFGASGQQALPEMALPTFTAQPVVVDGMTATGISVTSLGNANLRPERVREHEFGFDAAALRNRMQVELTWYRRRTVDQIVQQPLPPGLGSTYTNVGLTTAGGFEAGIGATVLDTRYISWDLSLRHSSNSTRLIDIGDAAENPYFGGGYKEGYPLGARFLADPLVGYEDVNGNGIIDGPEIQYGDTAIYIGQSTPTRTQALTTAVGFFDRRLRISALLDRSAGFTQQMPNTCNANACLALLDPTTPLQQQAAALASRGRMAFPAAYTRLREVTAAIDLPPGMLHALRLRSGMLSVAARNLALWTAFRGADPESAFVSGLVSSASFGGIPQTRSWTFRFDLGL